MSGNEIAMTAFSVIAACAVLSALALSRWRNQRLTGRPQLGGRGRGETVAFETGRNSAGIGKRDLVEPDRS